MVKLVFWGKKMGRGAFLFLAVFPLISLFPIPPPVYECIEEAKQERPKRKENSDGSKEDPIN